LSSRPGGVAEGMTPQCANISNMRQQVGDVVAFACLGADLGRVPSVSRRFFEPSPGFGGDRDWEIAAEIHTIADERLLYLRVWLHARQRFVLYVVDREGVIRDRATSDYTQAKQRALSQLVA